MKKWMLLNLWVVLFLGGGVACEGKSGALNQKKALALAKRAVAHFKLTEVPGECLQWEDITGPDYFAWKVIEKQNDACGGDPRFQPREFEVRTDRKTGKMSSDAKTLPGEFSPLE